MSDWGTGRRHGTGRRICRRVLPQLVQEEWLLLEEGLHPSRAVWVELALKKTKIAHRSESDEEGVRFLVPRSEENLQALARTDDLILAYHMTKEAALEEGIKITPYKPLERHVAFMAALVAERTGREGRPLDYLAALLHEFTWAQPLPNANHRSALLLVNKVAREIGLRLGDPDDLVAAGDEFARISKPLIGEKEYLPDHSEQKTRHHETAAKAVERLFG